MTLWRRASERRTGSARLVAGSGLLLFAGAAVTSAAFTDSATLNLGNGAIGSGVGNPTPFDIAVHDAQGQLQDAATAGDAVVLPLAEGTVLNENDPIAVDVRFANRDPGIVGDFTLRLFDPDPTDDGDLFDQLLFDVYVQGASVPAIAGATAGEVNEAGLTEESVEPGGEVDVRIEVVVTPGTGAAVAGMTTQLGVRAEGESR